MNDANVKALAELLEAIPGDFIHKTKHERDITIDDLSLAQIAAALAARGVLVPTALTDEHVEDLTDGFEYGKWHGAPWDDDAGDYSLTAARDEMARRLERIAKGETP